MRRAAVRLVVHSGGVNVEPSAGVAERVRPAPIARREVIVTVAATALVWLLFSGFWLFVPLRLLVTLVHEASHALAAMATGADVGSVTVNRFGGGLTRFRGDTGTFGRLVIASAGYVGTALVGAVMLELCRRLRSGRVALGGLAFLVAAIGLAWVPWRVDDIDAVSRAATGSGSGDGRFTILVCVLAVAALAALAAQPWVQARRTAVIVLATCLCFGAVEDLRRVFDISRTGGHSDAAIAADLTPLPSWLWAALWLVLGVVVCAGAVWSVAVRRPSDDSPAAPAGLDR